MRNRLRRAQRKKSRGEGGLLPRCARNPGNGGREGEESYGRRGGGSGGRALARPNVGRKGKGKEGERAQPLPGKLLINL